MQRATTVASGDVLAANTSPVPDNTLRALLIGIDLYESRHISNLSGAVADADAMEQYIRHLHPRADITTLRNEDATRRAIIQEIVSLQYRDGVRPSDPFLIYFAGHGTAARAPNDWPAGSGGISMLVPYDGTEKHDDYGNSTRNIPDRIIGSLLHQLVGRDANITVILDCCHAGSGARADAMGGDRVRGSKMEDALPLHDKLNRDIWADTDRNRAAKGYSLSPPANERAWERRHSEDKYNNVHRSGFTGALLEVLHEANSRVFSTSYESLMEDVKSKVKGQTPRCESFDTDHIPYDVLVPSSRFQLYPVVVENREYDLRVGSLHGITHGAQFRLYSTRGVNRVRVATHASEVMASTCKLSSDNGTTPAVTSGCPHQFSSPVDVVPITALRLDVPHALKALVQSAIELLKAERGGLELDIIAGLDDTDLSFYDCDGAVHYAIHDPDIRDGGKHELYGVSSTHDVPGVYSVLRAASHFFWHLRRGQSFTPAYHSHITVEIYTLKPVENEIGPHYVQRTRENLRSGVLEAVDSPRMIYGLKIENKSPVDLYLWVFYFDCSDLSITSYYRPPWSPGCEPPLPAGSYITIGYGPSGGRPWRYALPKGRNLDIGFVKFFFSTQPVDLSDIDQQAAFVGRVPRTPPRAPSSINGNDLYTFKFIVMQRKDVS
ncbi:hypothetical protein PENSPDRAFT_328057 [Peniophora sp. CONT]|nr:hypothetical protein PENSPDRAFT_328057 [Peniophora sp. CONT]